MSCLLLLDSTRGQRKCLVSECCCRLHPTKPGRGVNTTSSACDHIPILNAAVLSEQQKQPLRVGRQGHEPGSVKCNEESGMQPLIRGR